MKKHLLFIFLTILFAESYAQFFPKVGLTGTTTSSDNPNGDLKEKLKAGFLLGAGYQLSFGNFVVQPELMFIQKGTTKETSVQGPIANISEKEKITINYLELPVLFKYSLGPDALRIFLSAGPSFAVGLGGKGSYEGSIDLGNGPVSESYDFKVKFENEPEGYEGNDLYIKNKTDVGLQMGGGLVLARKLMVDLRYGLGFSDWGNETNTKNRVFQLSVGVLLGN